MESKMPANFRISKDGIRAVIKLPRLLVVISVFFFFSVTEEEEREEELAFVRNDKTRRRR